MKKLLSFVLIIILAFSFSVPFLSEKISSDEQTAFEAARHWQTEKRLYALYENICTCYSLGNYSDCSSQCKSWLETASPSEYSELRFDVLFKKAVSEYECQHLSDALASCSDALELSENCAEVYLLKSKIFLSLNDTESEKEALKGYIAISGDKSLCARVGAIELENGDLLSAINAFNEYDISCLSPIDSTDSAIYSRGVCYMSLSDYVRAAEDFRRCFENGVERDNSAFDLAVCEMKLGETSKAKESFEYCAAHSFRAEEAKALIELCNTILQ